MRALDVIKQLVHLGVNKLGSWRVVRFCDILHLGYFSQILMLIAINLAGLLGHICEPCGRPDLVPPNLCNFDDFLQLV